MQSFWESLPQPFLALAPMADVTDPAFRKLIAEYSKDGAPYVTWTEFVSADGLYHLREKKKVRDHENPLLRDLMFSEEERPVVAQFFTRNPAMMEYAAALAVTLGFDGVDINMGCPDRSIEKQGAGAAHIKEPERAQEVIRAALKGVQGQIPVSVKTRIGYNRIEYETWLPYLLSEDIAALTLHLRTRKELSSVPAHWELSGEIASFCRSRNPKVLVLGNGDVSDVKMAKRYAHDYELNGVMLGRAVFGNPWLFSGRRREDISSAERLEALGTLARYFSMLQPSKHYEILKKHFKAFVSGYDGAAELRAALMETHSLEDLEVVLAHAKGA